MDFIVEVAYACNTFTVPLDLKPLPDSLEYAFLGYDESFPVEPRPRTKTAKLRENKEALGWTLRDIKGRSPTIVHHRIHLEDGARHYRDPQRWLNMTLQKIVRRKY